MEWKLSLREGCHGRRQRSGQNQAATGQTPLGQLAGVGKLQAEPEQHALLVALETTFDSLGPRKQTGRHLPERLIHSILWKGGDLLPQTLGLTAPHGHLEVDPRRARGIDLGPHRDPLLELAHLC